jgi:hypothetical protein
LREVRVAGTGVMSERTGLWVVTWVVIEVAFCELGCSR